MFNGDRARKLTLVDYGFRLPSALDNRPLMFDEFLALTPRARVRVGDAGASSSCGCPRASSSSRSFGPTGLIDPEIEIRPVRGQVDDLLNEIRMRERKGERVLVTTLTKRMAEDLTDYLQQVGVRVRYMHSDIDAIERMEIVRGLRLGEFDVLVGINLLREGLDLPEVSLVAILDADQEGFLRSDRSLIQTVGRAARHVHGRAIFYADRITGSMQRCIEETARRREIQTRAQHRATTSRRSRVSKSIDQVRFITRVADARVERRERSEKKVAEPARGYAVMETESLEKMLEEQMREAATAMDFELAAQLRDQLFEVRARSDERRRSAKAGRRRACARRPMRMSHEPIVPPLARTWHVWRSRESELVELGRAVRPRRHGAARRHDHRRAGRGKDDARAGDLPRLRRDGGRHEPDVRARARVRGAAVAGAIISISIGSTVRTSSTNLGWDEIVARAMRWCSSSGRSARATGFRAVTCRSVLQHLPGRSGSPAALRGRARRDHARARRVDLRRRRRGARRRRACWPSAAWRCGAPSTSG